MRASMASLAALSAQLPISGDWVACNISCRDVITEDIDLVHEEPQRPDYPSGRLDYA